ncbi:MAG: rubrerythrin family protein [Desulfurococcales archaeon]|nr:rubrerythrin family protein [Desulfurococcales archaeon]
MLAGNPLDYLSKKDLKLDDKGVLQALRWAIIAELDAINFYEQLASHIEDENVKKIFLAVANEEKEHVGEFLALLLSQDKDLYKYMMDGFKEVEEETGIKTNL